MYVNNKLNKKDGAGMYKIYVFPLTEVQSPRF